MVKVYSAANITEAHIVRGMLEANDIPAYVGGHYLQGGVGELAPMDFATVYVEDEYQQQARTLIDRYQQAEA